METSIRDILSVIKDDNRFQGNQKQLQAINVAIAQARNSASNIIALANQVYTILSNSTRVKGNKKSAINSFKIIKTGYGHWLITLVIENPALNLPDEDIYWEMNDKNDEPKTFTLKHISTNSRAIDGHDGFEIALASECLQSNNLRLDLFDFSTLLAIETE